MEFDFLGEVERYDNGAIKEAIGDVDIEKEIQRISADMDDIHIESLKFDKWDFTAIFTVALMEVGTDFIFGDPKKGLSKELSDKNSRLGKFFNDIHDKIDHKGNPLDYQGAHFGGGDHRGRTFGHDLFMFPLAIYSLCSGKFIDGFYEDGAFEWIVTNLNQYGNEYQGMPFDQALLAYLAHMFADFFSTKSLPVPGFGILSHVPSREIRKIVNQMYADGFNLRHMFVQGISVVIAEIMIRLFFYFRYRNIEAPADAKKQKLRKTLLMTHSLSALVNMGKVYFTSNPAAINLPMLTRVVWLTWSVVKEESSISHMAKVKADYGVIKNKYETLQTLVLLDQAVYYTQELNKFIHKKHGEFVVCFERNEAEIAISFDGLDDLMTEFKSLNRPA